MIFDNFVKAVKSAFDSGEEVDIQFSITGVMCLKITSYPGPVTRFIPLKEMEKFSRKCEASHTEMVKFLKTYNSYNP